VNGEHCDRCVLRPIGRLRGNTALATGTRVHLRTELWRNPQQADAGPPKSQPAGSLYRTQALKEDAMSIFSTARSNSSYLRGLAASAIVLWPLVGMAHLDSPFASFSGSWKGSGEVVGTDNKHERIACRASYSISGKGDALTQTLVCASDSYRFEISSYVIAEGRNVQGHWQETTRQVQGSLTGEVADGQFDGNVAGPGFTAELSLKAVGRKQLVSIKPQGGDIAKVEIVLTRAS
jgi:hypothetical protein